MAKMRISSPEEMERMGKPMRRRTWVVLSVLVVIVLAAITFVCFGTVQKSYEKTGVSAVVGDSVFRRESAAEIAALQMYYDDVLAGDPEYEASKNSSDNAAGTQASPSGGNAESAMQDGRPLFSMESIMDVIAYGFIGEGAEPPYEAVFFYMNEDERSTLPFELGQRCVINGSLQGTLVYCSSSLNAQAQLAQWNPQLTDETAVQVGVYPEQGYYDCIIVLDQGQHIDPGEIVNCKIIVGELSLMSLIL